jgi:phosphoribosylformylglycinamidine synthase PurS subunit
MGDSPPIRARVYVTLKRTVLDPQGQTIRAALAGLGYGAIGDVRQGKYFEIAISGDQNRAQAARELDEIAREVLANPVIEEYRVEILD